MSRNHLLGIVLGVTTAAGILVTQSRGQTESTTKSSPNCCVGVVDFVRIFNDCQQIRDLNELIQDKEAKIQAETKTRRDAIDLARETMGAFKTGTPDFEARRKEWLRLTIEASAWLQTMEQDLELRKVDWTRVIYEAAVQMSQEIARDRGYAVVLQTKEFNPENIEPNVTAIRRVIHDRDLVFADGALDITEAVIQRLDQQYQASGGRKTLWPADDPEKKDQDGAP